MPYQPFVSVIVATYNQEQFICDTLDSILSQDYPNFEVVVADDGSRDRTPELITDYARRFPGKIVPVLNPKNKGVTANCNSALSAARGELIALMAGDDLFLPGKLTAQVAVFGDPEVVLSYHPVEIFDSDSGETLYITNRTVSEDVSDFRDIILKSGIAGSASVMVRRSAVPQEGYDERVRTVSDWLFFIEVALRGKIAKVDRVLGRYRKHRGGTTARIADYLEETLSVLDIALEKHPNVPGLEDVCRKGKARYLGGEAFRAMYVDPVRARAVAERALRLDPRNAKYKAMVLLTRFPFVSRLVGLPANRFKYAIKRIVPYNP